MPGLQTFPEVAPTHVGTDAQMHAKAGRQVCARTRAPGLPPGSRRRVRGVSCLRKSQAALKPRGLGPRRAAPEFAASRPSMPLSESN